MENWGSLSCGLRFACRVGIERITVGVVGRMEETAGSRVVWETRVFWEIRVYWETRVSWETRVVWETRGMCATRGVWVTRFGVRVFSIMIIIIMLTSAGSMMWSLGVRVCYGSGTAGCEVAGNEAPKGMMSGRRDLSGL